MDCLVDFQKRPKFIDFIEKFQLSGAYPVFFAVLCTISGLGNKYVYLPIISILVLSVIFSALFVRDSKVLIAPFFMMYYSLGADNQSGYQTSSGVQSASFDEYGFMGICIIALILATVLVLRFIHDGTFTLAFRKRSRIFKGLLMLDLSILLGGVFSPHWSMQALAWGAVIAAGLTVFYLVFYSITENHDKDEITAYMCRVLVLTCLAIAVQTAVMLVRTHLEGEFVEYNKYYDAWRIQRENLNLSWGVPTIIGAVIVLGIPAAFYLAKRSKISILYYLSGFLFLSVPLILNARSSLFVGAAILAFSIICVCISGKNKISNSIFTAFLIIAAVVLYFKFRSHLDQQAISFDALMEELYAFFRFDVISDRISLFSKGFNDFKRFPVFGVGWSKGASVGETLHHSLFNDMYHCFPVQIIASAGVFGALSALIHILSMFKPIFRKTNTDRLLISCVFIMILTMSLADNFFFYPNFQIFYTAFLVIAERHLDKTKEPSL